LSSEATHKAGSDSYDFGAPVDTGFHGHTYGDLVFPERKMY
jgi:hypothetical protein